VTAVTDANMLLLLGITVAVCRWLICYSLITFYFFLVHCCHGMLPLVDFFIFETSPDTITQSTAEALCRAL